MKYKNVYHLIYERPVEDDYPISIRKHQMSPYQPQARSLDDLPSYIPRYIYQNHQQFREIRQIELIRYQEINDAANRRNNGKRNAYVHPSLVNSHYQERLEELNNRYRGSMPQKKCDKFHQSDISSSRSAAVLKSYRRSTLEAFFKNPTSYILFHIHQSRFEKDFLQGDTRERFSHFQNNQLLVMAPPSVPHGIAAGEMTQEIISWVIGMNLRHDLTLYQNSGITAIDDPDEVRIPDSAFGPRESPAGSPMTRPTCVVEIGKTQSLGSLEDDAKWWLDPLKGGIAACITCKLDRTPRIVIDAWERQGSDGQEAKIRRASHIIITKLKKSNEITIRGSPLRLEFHLLFGRLPVGQEHDLVIDDNQLRTIAQKIWRVQGLL